MARADISYDYEDFGLTAEELQAKYDREHPEYTNLAYNGAFADAVDDAQPSYWNWVVGQIAKDDDALSGNDENGNPLPTEVPVAEQTAEQAKEELVAITNLDMFAGYLVQWHRRQRAQAEHIFQVPEGMEIEVQIGENDPVYPVKLVGDARQAFLGGAAAVLNLFAQLPFAAMPIEPAEATAPAANEEGKHVG